MSRKTTGTPVATRRRVAVGTALLSTTALIGSGLALATPGETPTVSHVYAYGTETAAVGPLSGGSSAVSITGTNFDQDVKVFFGAVQAAKVVKESASSLVVTPPAGTAGKVDVTVVTGDSAGSGLSTAVDDYTYTAGPIVTSVATVGTPKKLVVTGSQLTGATAVLVGDTLTKVAKATSTVKPVNDAGTEVSIPVPSVKGGSYDVSVVTPLGIGTKAAAWGVAPVISKLWVPGVDSRNKAVEVVASRGTDRPTATATATTASTATALINITGTGFTGLTSVKFGDAEATFAVVSDTQARVAVPTIAAADLAKFTESAPNSLKVTVAATNPYGTGSKANGWQYDRLPTITSATAKNGDVVVVEKKTSDTGTTTITVTGTNLYKVTAVKLAKSATDTAGTTLTKVSAGTVEGTKWTGTFKTAKTGTTAGATQLWLATSAGLVSLPDVLTWKTS